MRFLQQPMYFVRLHQLAQPDLHIAKSVGEEKDVSNGLRQFIFNNEESR